MRFLQALPLLAAVAAAAPQGLPKLPNLLPSRPDKAPLPTISVAGGAMIGHVEHGVESFNGIPFAEPPVKELRLRPPKPLTSNFGTIKSEKNARSCPQFYFRVDSDSPLSNVAGGLANNPILQGVQDAGEDCLTINVQRPVGVDASTKLPVIFWIFGGGFELGSTQMYDGAKFVNASATLGQPVVWVAVNYRVAGFGFLAGKELAAEGSTNLGLRDQRLGMQWVADNIAKFGGDPDKVTIWGESAGALSVYDQLVINGGDNTYNGKALFRGAIMNSGSAIPVDPVTAPQAQKIYDSVVQQAGCAKEADSLDCLRHAPYTRLLNAVNSVPGLIGPRSVDLSYIPRPDPGDDFFPESPEVPGIAGRWPKIPLIIGDQQDEGTLFALPVPNITTNNDLVDYLASYFPNNPNAMADVQGLLATNYPDEPGLGQPAGSPFNTGSENNIYPQFKRLAAVLGDITFTLTRRVLLNYASELTPCWSYLATYLHGTPIYGTGHGSDLLFNWGFLGQDKFPTQSIQAYYLNFIYNLDPNVGVQAPALVNWPKYDTQSRTLLEFGNTTNGLMPDTFRMEASEFISGHTENFRV